MLASVRARQRLIAAGLVASVLLLGGCSRSPWLWRQDLEDGDPFVRRLAAAALGETRPPDTSSAVGSLLLHLDDRDPQVRTTIAEALAKVSTRDVQALVREVESVRVENPETRAALHVALRCGEPELLPRLVALLREAIEIDLENAATLFQAFECRAVAPLAVLVLEQNAPSSARAASVLARSGCDLALAVPALCAALEGVDGELRRSAAAALATSDDRRARDALDRVRDDPDPAIRFARRRPEVRAAAKKLLTSDSADKARILDELSGLDEEGFRVLVGVLDDIDPLTARAAASALKQIADPHVGGTRAASALDAFAGRSSDTDASVRALALLTTVEKGEAKGAAIATLIAGLDDPAPAVRICAALSLSRLGPCARDALPRLRECSSSDASRLVRDAAGLTVARIERP